MSASARPHIVVFKTPHRISKVSQRLMLQERLLTEQIHRLARERQEVRSLIRRALDGGAKCEAGMRSAVIVTRHVLLVR
jgi:hypothetical protein